MCWVLPSSDNSEPGIRQSIPDSICLGADILRTDTDTRFLNGSFPSIRAEGTGAGTLDLGTGELGDFSHQRDRRSVPIAVV